MTVEISPSAEIPPAIRLQSFSTSVSASVVVGPAVISSVTAHIVGSLDPGIIITSGPTSVTISGKHITGFEDILTYVDQGQSDKTQTPKSVSGIENMPVGQTLFNLNQDKKQSLDRQFLITVTLNDNSTESFVVKQTVLNDLESMTAFMGSYFS